MFQLQYFPVTSSALLLTIATGTLLSLSSAIYGAQLSIADVTTAPGATAMVSIHLDSQGTSISGIQFDLAWDSRAMIISPVPAAAMKAANKELYTTSLDARKRRQRADAVLSSPAPLRRSRLLIIGLNQNVVPDDELLRLSVVVAPKASLGIYKLQLSNIIATTPDGQAVTVATANPSIIVQNAAPRPEVSPSK